MPRSRGLETPQQQQPPAPAPARQSPRAPLHLRTTNSESNGVHTHHRSSPKLEDNHRRSPRSPLHEVSSCNQKKRGSRVTDLETKLGHVQEELKKLREQLASAEAAKRDAQHELEETKKLIPTTRAAGGEQVEEECGHSLEDQVQQDTQEKDDELAADASPAEEEGEIQVDTVELVSPPAAAGDLVLQKADDGNNDAVVEEEVVKEKGECSEDQLSEVINGEEGKEAASAVVVEADQEVQSKESPEKAEISELEAKLAEKVRELECCLAENAGLKKQLVEAEANAAAARTREVETALKLTHVAEELAGSRTKADQLEEHLEAAEGAKASLETEMKKLRIQTDQWRKAADAAVAALSATGGMRAEANGQRVGERCGSMDKHLGVGYTGGGGGDFAGLGSPLMMADESDDGLGGGKRKGAGIRVFGDLWKKRGQQK